MLREKKRCIRKDAKSVHGSEDKKVGSTYSVGRAEQETTGEKKRLPLKLARDL